jgi:Zn-dependent alcohol dehydrogenase
MPVATPPPSEKFEAKEEVATDVVASHTSVESSTAIVVQPEPVQKVDPPMDPATVATIAVGGVAVAGAAAASSAMGGFSAVQAKIASLFGSTKAAVASTAVITAGTIVAVKALEGKMNGLEKDLEKTKKEVGDAASSIDRIDSLLDRLGN